MNFDQPIEKTINRKLIVDALAPLLYTTGIVPDEVEISNIQFSNLFGASTEEYCNIKIYFKPTEGKATADHPVH